MKLLFVSPHSKLSGGTKVIFNLAQRLSNDHKVIVAAHKLKDTKLMWLPFKRSFAMIERKTLNKKNLPNVDCIINFCDGTAFAPIGKVPHILFLQGFGTQNYEREAINILYPYDGVICTSSWLAEIARKSGHKKVYIVPPGIDNYFRSMPIAKAGKRVTVGCLYHEALSKNISMFAASINKLIAKNFNVQVLFLSVKQPTNPDLTNGINCPVSFAINPPQHLLPSVYSSCSVWVSPSLSEGFGLPILEAMACEVPTVVIPSFGLDDYLKNEHNCILIENNKESIANGIIKALTNQAIKKQLIVGGKELSKQFTWGAAAKNFQIAVQNIVKGTRHEDRFY